jgi:phosphotransferase system enzyme I (PtsI)
VIQTGQRAGLSVSVCGEMAGDPRMTRLLLGMGLRVFSMHPAQILEIKQNILMADAAQLMPKVNRLLRFEETEKIRESLGKINLTH